MWTFVSPERGSLDDSAPLRDLLFLQAEAITGRDSQHGNRFIFNGSVQRNICVSVYRDEPDISEEDLNGGLSKRDQTMS